MLIIFMQIILQSFQISLLEKESNKLINIQLIYPELNGIKCKNSFGVELQIIYR